MKFKYPPWWKDIKVGDVLESPNGTMRAIREVKMGADPNHTWVHLVIQRCSWTGRCYTVYTIGELIRMGYRLLDGSIPLRTKFDKLIRAEFGKREKGLTCCDVRGIA